MSTPAKWLASGVPEWLVLVVFGIGLPAAMLLLERRVHKWAPNWRRGEHNDATGIMLSIAAVVYSVAMGLCVVTLWEERDDALAATEAEAQNLAAVATASQVCDPAAHTAIVNGVADYQRQVLAGWSQRIAGHSYPGVGTALDGLVTTVGQLRPRNEPQRAFVLDATQRLSRQTELRAHAIRLAQEQKLPDVLWTSVLVGSVVVLGLCLTCGIRDRVLRALLVTGVAVTVGVNLFLVVELNYPFYGSVRVAPDSYRDVLSELELGR